MGCCQARERARLRFGAAIVTSPGENVLSRLACCRRQTRRAAADF